MTPSLRACTTTVAALALAACPGPHTDETDDPGNRWSMMASEVPGGVLLSAWSRGDELVMVGGELRGPERKGLVAPLSGRRAVHRGRRRPDPVVGARRQRRRLLHGRRARHDPAPHRRTGDRRERHHRRDLVRRVGRGVRHLGRGRCGRHGHRRDLGSTRGSLVPAHRRDRRAGVQGVERLVRRGRGGVPAGGRGAGGLPAGGAPAHRAGHLRRRSCGLWADCRARG